ncbi:WG repeat-containing protein [Flavobacteriaceae bacterium M23B6Z8]
MKNIILICLLWLVPASVLGQQHTSLQAIGEFSDSLIAIKKADQWGFADMENKIVIDYRDDVVTEEYTKSITSKAPVFKNGLCMIVADKDGIPFYGFIDKSGQIAITPQFLNVTNFNNGYAIAIVAERKNRGRNEYLNKDIIAYSFYEVIINREGQIVKDLGDVPHILMTAKKYKKPYSTSHFVSPLQVATETNTGEWQLIYINTNQ